jgi:hypothetical protein
MGTSVTFGSPPAGGSTAHTRSSEFVRRAVRLVSGEDLKPDQIREVLRGKTRRAIPEKTLGRARTPANNWEPSRAMVAAKAAAVSMAEYTLPAGVEPEFVTVQQTKVVTGLGKTKIYELIAKGAFDTIKVGKKWLVRLRSARNLRQAA